MSFKNDVVSEEIFICSPISICGRARCAAGRRLWDVVHANAGTIVIRMAAEIGVLWLEAAAVVAQSWPEIAVVKRLRFEAARVNSSWLEVTILLT